MKKFAIAGLVLIASMVLGSSGWAQSKAAQQGVAPELPADSFFTIKGQIAGTFTSNSSLATSTLPSGPCTGGTAGFAAQCATGHTCLCFEDIGAKFTSTVIGKGTANVFITIDQTAGYGLPIPSNPSNITCYPYVAEFDVAAKNDTEELEAVGGECVSDPSPGHNGFQLGGAFGAETSKLFTAEAAPFILSVKQDNSFKMPFIGLAANFPLE